MAVIGTAQELPDSPQFHGNLNQRSYTRKFLVKTTSVLDGPLVVIAAQGIPLLYSPYVFGNERDGYALVRNLQSERIIPGSPHWHVTAEYSTPEPRGGTGSKPAGTSTRDQQGANDNPLLWLPEVETSMEKFQEVVYAVYDISGAKRPPGAAPEAPQDGGFFNFGQVLGWGGDPPAEANPWKGPIVPCQASNREIFDPPPVKDASRLTMTITRNEDINSNHPAGDVIYTDAVNSDRFWGCPAGTWKCMGISTKRETKQLSNTTFPYLRCTYKFEARPYWDLLLLDHGTFYTDTAPEKVPFAGPTVTRKKFLTDDGHPTTGPLNGKGGKLPDGSPPVFRVFRVYRRLPFSRLHLPQSFTQVA